MIPSADVQEWSATTPWPDPRQVEQDLIICRALCDIFNDRWLSERLAFRGGPLDARQRLDALPGGT